VIAFEPRRLGLIDLRWRDLLLRAALAHGMGLFSAMLASPRPPPRGQVRALGGPIAPP
jgi:hypothetical protein